MTPSDASDRSWAKSAKGLVLLMIALSGCSTSAAGNGDLDFGEGVNTVSAGANRGATLTYASNVGVNTGDETAVLRSAALLGIRPRGAVSVTSVRVLPLAPDVTPVAVSDTYPEKMMPRKSLRRLDGYRARPSKGDGEQFALVYTLRVRATEKFRAKGIVVEYEVGGHHYRLERTNALVICVPKVLDCEP